MWRQGITAVVPVITNKKNDTTNESCVENANKARERERERERERDRERERESEKERERERERERQNRERERERNSKLTGLNEANYTKCLVFTRRRLRL